MSLVVLGVVIVLAGSFLQLTSSVSRRQALTSDRRQAFYLAESGLADAFAGLSLGRTGRIGSQAEPARFGDGLFWVDVEEAGGGRLRLESTGMAGGGKAVLSMVVEPGSDPIADLGLFSGQGLVVRSGALVDAYDSSQGPYGALAPLLGVGEEAPKARVGSNGPIELYGPPGRAHATVVEGDVTPGWNEEVTIDGTVRITGSTAAARARTLLPPIAVPSIPPQRKIEHGHGLPLLLGPGELAPDELVLDEHAEVVLRGPLVLVTRKLETKRGALLVLDASEGPVHLYVTHSLDLDHRSTVTTPAQDPTAVSLLVGDDGKVELSARSSFHGTIYGPEADVEVHRRFEIFGSLVAKSVELGEGAAIHIDVHLADVAEDEERPRVRSWRIVELSDPRTGSLGDDPFSILGVEPSALALPADAHQDVWLRIDYVDLGGGIRSYDGWESGFDWRDVDFPLVYSRYDAPAGTKLRKFEF